LFGVLPGGTLLSANPPAQQNCVDAPAETQGRFRIRLKGWLFDASA
jgi:hypothetical protein